MSRLLMSGEKVVSGLNEVPESRHIPGDLANNPAFFILQGWRRRNRTSLILKICAVYAGFILSIPVCIAIGAWGSELHYIGLYLSSLLVINWVGLGAIKKSGLTHLITFNDDWLMTGIKGCELAKAFRAFEPISLRLTSCISGMLFLAYAGFCLIKSYPAPRPPDMGLAFLLVWVGGEALVLAIFMPSSAALLSFSLVRNASRGRQRAARIRGLIPETRLLDVAIALITVIRSAGFYGPIKFAGWAVLFISLLFTTLGPVFWSIEDAMSVYYLRQELVQTLVKFLVGGLATGGLWVMVGRGQEFREMEMMGRSFDENLELHRMLAHEAQKS